MANTNVAYLATTIDQGYALDYIISRKAGIMNAAAKIGISAGAIAGAMAEENTSGKMGTEPDYAVNEPVVRTSRLSVQALEGNNHERRKKLY